MRTRIAWSVFNVPCHKCKIIRVLHTKRAVHRTLHGRRLSEASRPKSPVRHVPTDRVEAAVVPNRPRHGAISNCSEARSTPGSWCLVAAGWSMRSRIAQYWSGAPLRMRIAVRRQDTTCRFVADRPGWHLCYGPDFIPVLPLLICTQVWTRAALVTPGSWALRKSPCAFSAPRHDGEHVFFA